MASAVQRTKQTIRQTERESEKKWSKPAIAAGFTIFPNTLLYKQHALGLDCIDVVLILQIAKHWWRADQAPYPSQVQLAKTMNIDLATVKRHLKRLRDAGLISWANQSNKRGGQGPNAYSLAGLVKHVEEFAKEELAEREKTQDERKERLRRKRPRGKPALRVVTGQAK